MINAILELLQNYWNAAIEILLLAVAIYYGYLYFRGTRGAKVLTGLAILFITLTLVSQILNLTVISWLLRSLTAFLAIALVVIFQPELRRALAELASSQIGALLAIERDTAIRTFAESGVNIDCDMSQELLITIFFPKTPLHDGGVIIRKNRMRLQSSYRRRQGTFRYVIGDESSADLNRDSSRNAYPNCCCAKAINP